MSTSKTTSMSTENLIVGALPDELKKPLVNLRQTCLESEIELIGSINTEGASCDVAYLKLAGCLIVSNIKSAKASLTHKGAVK